MHSIEVSQQTFQVEVLDKSSMVPVVVDFWAEWCQPCRILKPLLEALATEFAGQFILAKINVDQNQALAAKFGVRGIPSVKAFVDGRLVDEFSGVLPESDVRNFLSRIIPSRSEKLRFQALSIYASGDSDAALEMLDKAIELDENNYPAFLEKAKILMDMAQLDAAEQIILKLPPAMDSDPAFKELKTKIDIARRRAALPDMQTLQNSIQQNPDDLQLKLDLANVYIADQNFTAALELLLEIIARDKTYGDGIARKSILDIFSLLGNQGDEVREARKKLSRLLN